MRAGVYSVLPKLSNCLYDHFPFLMPQSIVYRQPYQPFMLLCGILILPIKAAKFQSRQGGVKGYIVEHTENAMLLHIADKPSPLLQVSELHIEHMGL